MVLLVIFVVVTVILLCCVYRIRQNFRGGKLSRLCTKHTIHWKTFAVHQAHAIIYCTQQMIQGENFRDWLENHESFPPRKFCRIRYFVVASLLFHVWLYVCVYVPTCVLYRSGKEERPWPISGAKINNHQSINQSIINQSCTSIN